MGPRGDTEGGGGTRRGAAEGQGQSWDALGLCWDDLGLCWELKGQFRVVLGQLGQGLEGAGTILARFRTALRQAGSPGGLSPHPSSWCSASWGEREKKGKKKEKGKGEGKRGREREGEEKRGGKGKKKRKRKGKEKGKGKGKGKGPLRGLAAGSHRLPLVLSASPRLLDVKINILPQV